MIFAEADSLSIIVQIFGGAGLIAGGYFILKDLAEFKLKIADRVQARLKEVEEEFEKCQRRCARYRRLLIQNKIEFDDEE